MATSDLPARVKQLCAIAFAVGPETGVDPCLLLAVADRETFCGRNCKPPGPTGTGDFEPRHWRKYEDFPWAKDRLRVFSDTKAGLLMCMPKDGLGWGRGLFQLDWADPGNFEFLDKKMPDGTCAWESAIENCQAAALKLAKLIHAFDNIELFACAAYNAGEHRVRQAILALTEPSSKARREVAADSVTTGRNYGSDVMGRRDRFRKALDAPHLTQPE